MLKPTIFISGSGPGTGKSAIAGGLHTRLEQHQIPVHCWYEIEVLQRAEFKPFFAHFMRGEPTMVEALQNAISQYVSQHVPEHKALLTESLIPFLRWLILGDTPAARINDYCRWLNEYFADWTPNLIVLNCDAEAALERARRERGEKWYTQWLLKEQNYPLYKRQPDCSRWEIFTIEQEYFQQLNWPTIEIDTSKTPLDEAINQILAPYALPEYREIETKPLQPGIYCSEHDNPLLQEIEITAQQIKMMGVWLDLVPYDAEGFRIARSNSTLHAVPEGLELSSNRFGRLKYYLSTATSHS